MASSKIEGERLDLVLQRLRDKGESSAVPATDEFAAVLSRLSDKPMAEGSMESLLIDFIMPIIKDAGIFQESRAIMLLEHLRDQLLPRLNVGSEMAQPEMLTRVINEEIARYNDVRERRHSGIAA